MHSTVLLPSLLAFLPVTAAVTNIWLAGDSTMASGGGGTGTAGWGQYLQYSFDKTQYLVNNKAIAGRSARSYRREGRFQAIADGLTAGDVSLLCPVHPKYCYICSYNLLECAQWLNSWCS